MLKNGLHYNKEVEKAVIGSFILNPAYFGLYESSLPIEFIYGEDCKLVYECIKEMVHNGICLDIVTIASFMSSKQIVLPRDLLLAQKDETFNYTKALNLFLVEITKDVIISNNLKHWIRLLNECYRRRIFHNLLGEIEHIEHHSSLDHQIEVLEKGIASIRKHKDVKDWIGMPDLLYSIGLYQDQKKINPIGLPIGIPKFDKLGGLIKGQLVIVAARPGIGKSVLATQMACSMADKQFNVGIINLEMSQEETTSRLIANKTGNSFSKIFNGESSIIPIVEKNKNIEKLPIFISSKTDVDIEKIRSKTIELANRQNVDCLIIDYLQLVLATPESKKNIREQIVAEISRGLKLLAKELNIVIVALCQLNRQLEMRKGNSKPLLSDLRESGSLEQDADIVMFLHSDYVNGVLVDENGVSNEYRRQLIIRKWRNGPANVEIELDFHPKTMSFTER